MIVPKNWAMTSRTTVVIMPSRRLYEGTLLLYRGLSTENAGILNETTSPEVEKIVRQFDSPAITHSYSIDTLVYNIYGPTYPKEIMEKVFSFSARRGAGSNVAVDLACGSGQATFDFCDRFLRTVAVDVSEAQIKLAREKGEALGKKSSSVEFVVAPASKLPLEDNFADLILCAQAWHWLDPDTVFPEIHRVLRKPGVLAVLSYGCPRIAHQKECDELFYNFFLNRCIWKYKTVKSYVVNHYHNVTLPYALAERHDMKQGWTASLESLKGFVQSWGTYNELCKQQPGNSALEDLLGDMRKTLLSTQLKNFTPDEPPNKKVPLSKITLELETPFCVLLMAKV